MTDRRRRPSDSRARRTSRPARRSAAGDALTPQATSSPRHGSNSLNLANPRKSRRAQSGYVDQVAPATSTAESARAYNRRLHQQGYIEQIQRRHRRRRFALIALIVVAVIVIAIAVGAFTYYSTVNSRLSLSHSNASEALTEAEEGPFYVLCVASLGTATAPEAPEGDGYLLVRVDADARQLTFIDIPSSIVTVDDEGEDKCFYELRQNEGDAGLIRAISKFADVPISQFIATDVAGIAGMVSQIGGLKFDITEMVDDPQAGTATIDGGETTLDGQTAVEVMRALNYQNSYEQRARYRTAFTVNLAATATASASLGPATAVSDLSQYVETSWDTTALLDQLNAVSPLQDLAVYAAVVPGYVSDDQPNVYEVRGSSWQEMMDIVKQGGSPADFAPVDATFDPASVTVEVKNGSGITGAAASVGELVTQAGYNVVDVGNMEDGGQYTETFVVYRDEAYASAASRVRADIGIGRVIDGGDYYSFDANLLVVVGTDYVAPG